MRAADFFCDRLGAVVVDIDDHDFTGVLARETSAEGASDAVGAASDNDDFVVKLHASIIQWASPVTTTAVGSKASTVQEFGSR